MINRNARAHGGRYRDLAQVLAFGRGRLELVQMVVLPVAMPELERLIGRAVDGALRKVVKAVDRELVQEYGDRKATQER